MPNAAKDSDILADLRDALSSVYPGAPDVVVGIVDGLPDMSHPSLKSASIEFLEAMIPADSRAPDVHGTGICSVIFGHGNEIRGIAPGCSGLVLPIFFGNKSENRVRPASQLDLARAIAFALERGVSIINVSAGQKTFTAEAETHLEQALRNCIDHRTLLVAAAGNDSCACIHLPAAVEYTLAVGASDADGKPIEASNWGAEYRRNGLLAPGENILVAAPGSGTTNATGTSYATAVVSGSPRYFCRPHSVKGTGSMRPISAISLLIRRRHASWKVRERAIAISSATSTRLQRSPCCAASGARVARRAKSGLQSRSQLRGTSRI